MKVTFKYKKAEADNIETYFFEPESKFEYTAGQFIEITIKHPHPDDRGEKRWFTLSSSPSDDLLSITTKINPRAGSTYKKALNKMQENTVLNVSDPMGDFVLPKLIQTPLIFVAGGIGITPFHSILNWLADKKEERPIKMIYGVHTEDEIIFQETFDRLGLKTTIVVGSPSPSWGGERGQVTAELINGLGMPTEDSLIFVSGPEPMTESLERELKVTGLKSSQLVLDFFPNYPEV